MVENINIDLFIKNQVINLRILFCYYRSSSTLTESPVKINYGPSRETRWSSEMGFGLQKCSLDDKWELYYKTYQSITNTKEL